MPRIHVIVADDDEDDFQTIMEAFAVSGIPAFVEHKTDGKQLLDVFFGGYGGERELPDLVLLDLNMPRMNGIQVLDKIRKDSSFDAVPIVVYTITFDKKQADLCFLLGASGYVIKGSSFSAMVTFVHELFRFVAGHREAPDLIFHDTRGKILL